jgi:hypothetical protein
VAQARYVKLLLYIFEQLSGLKINFEKSEILSIGGDNEVGISFAEIFNCQIGLFPIKYLGVPISAKRLRVIGWVQLEEKLGKNLDTWQGNFLSFGGRTVLINVNLPNTPIYHMSMFLLPKTMIKRMDKLRRKIFWQGESLKKKYHLVKWSKICSLKRKGD